MRANRLMTLDFGSIHLFARIAALGTIAAAAREMGISAPSATRKLLAVEGALDARLFNRSTRQLSLTEAGAAVLDWAQTAIGNLDKLNDRVGSVTGAPAGRIRVAVPHFGANSYLPAIFAAFLERYPDIAIDLSTTDSTINLIGEGFDLALRYGMLPDSRLVSVRLNRFDRIICAAPRYLERFGIPRDLDDLAQHRCIVHGPSDASNWAFIFGKQLHHQPIRVAIEVDNAFMLNPLCRAGAGVARLTLPAAKIGLASGELVRLYCDYECVEATGDQPSLWLVHIGKDLPHRVRLLVDFLKREVPSARRRFYGDVGPGTEGESL